MSIQLSSRGPLVSAWQHLMAARFKSYALAADGGPLRVDGFYGYDDRDVQREYERRTGQLVDGIVSDHDLQALGLTDAPPPPPPRHALLTFRGTGGIIGQDYTSRVAQLCSDVVEEIPIDYPAAMGGIPVGAASNPGAPSGRKCVEIAVEMGRAWIRSNERTFILGGYSLGAIAASKLRADLLPGGILEDHADRYAGGYCIGNPARQFGHTFYLGAIPGGYGIADWHLPEQACTWDWCELVDPGDLYANASGGEVGDILRTAYRLVMDTEVSDPIGTAVKLIPNLLRIVNEAGIELPVPNVPGILTGALAGLLLAFLPAEVGRLLGMGDNESAAAVMAAVEALRFFADQPPTADHISYEFRHAIPGMTYLDLAAQHTRHWASQKPVVR